MRFSVDGVAFAYASAVGGAARQNPDSLRRDVATDTAARMLRLTLPIGSYRWYTANLAGGTHDLTFAAVAGGQFWKVAAIIVD